jgi:hypothetical protein
MPPNDPALIMAGVMITLAFFALIGFIVWTLRHTTRLPAVIAALSTLIAVLPAVLYALYG